MFVTRPIERLINWSRVVAGIMVFVGFGFGAAILSGRVTGDWSAAQGVGILVASVLPGALVFYFAARAEAGKLWAAIALVITVCLQGVYLGIMPSPCLRLPGLAVCVACLTAVPEIRFQLRAERRRRRQDARGFEVMPPAAAPASRLPPRRMSVDPQSRVQ